MPATSPSWRAPAGRPSRWCGRWPRRSVGGRETGCSSTPSPTPPCTRRSWRCGPPAAWPSTSPRPARTARSTPGSWQPPSTTAPDWWSSPTCRPTWARPPTSTRSAGCWPTTTRSTRSTSPRPSAACRSTSAPSGARSPSPPGRKFLRAPRGTGALYVDASLAGRLVPLTPELGSVGAAGDLPFDLAPGARRFDTFEADIAGRLGLAVSARTAGAVGLDTIARLVRDRSADVTALLEAVDGVRLLDPSAIGIVSFLHDRLEPDEVRTRIGAEGVNVWINPSGGSPVDGARRPVLPSVRVSPHYLTDDDDLERLGRA